MTSVSPLPWHRLPGGSPEPPRALATVLTPANGARLTVNSQFAQGRPIPRRRNGWASGTCELAFPEFWLLPSYTNTKVKTTFS